MEKTMGTRSTSRVRAMVECAMLLAAYIVLSRMKFLHMPQGGDLTPASSLPLLMIGYRHGPKWASLAAIASSLLSMLLDGFYAPPAGTVTALVLCLLLDYFVADLAIVSAAGVNHFLGEKSMATLGISVAVSQLLHFLCVFTSGFLLWGSYAPEGMGAVYYSFMYNGSYCLPEGILTVVVALALFRTAPRLFSRQA